VRHQEGVYIDSYKGASPRSSYTADWVQARMNDDGAGARFRPCRARRAAAPNHIWRCPSLPPLAPAPLAAFTRPFLRRTPHRQHVAFSC